MYFTVVNKGDKWNIHRTANDYTGLMRRGYRVTSFRRYADAMRYVLNNGAESDIIDMGGSMNYVLCAA